MRTARPARPRRASHRRAGVSAGCFFERSDRARAAGFGCALQASLERRWIGAREKCPRARLKHCRSLGRDPPRSGDRARRSRAEVEGTWTGPLRAAVSRGAARSIHHSCMMRTRGSSRSSAARAARVPEVGRVERARRKCRGDARRIAEASGRREPALPRRVEERLGVDRDEGLVVENKSCGLQTSVETDRGRRRHRYHAVRCGRPSPTVTVRA
jgi:hypothetical protein